MNSLVHAMLALIISPHAELRRFSGAKYGVTAMCDLDLQSRVANVRLTGVPLGGTISGSGRLTDPTATQGTVVLERDFESKLARRFVKVKTAAYDAANGLMSVTVVVPIVGTTTIVLSEER